MRTLLALAALLVLTPAADAGPLRDRLRARLSGGSCQSCAGCQSAPALAPAPTDPADDRNISTDPRPVGAVVTTTGRTLLPNGDGTYRYADEWPVVLPASYSRPAYLPAGNCPSGKCPTAPRYALPVGNCPGGRCPTPVK